MDLVFRSEFEAFRPLLVMLGYEFLVHRPTVVVRRVIAGSYLPDLILKLSTWSQRPGNGMRVRFIVWPIKQFTC